MKTGAITNFRGEYFFLSNFYKADFEWRGETFFSSEHAFVYAKGFAAPDSVEAGMHFNAVLRTTDPQEAKTLGRVLNIDRDEWEMNKTYYMREIVHSKFLGVPGLAGALINTGVCMLVEGNTWGDKVWGRVFEDGKWVGENRLGVILMEERGYWLRGNLQ